MGKMCTIVWLILAFAFTGQGQEKTAPPDSSRIKTENYLKKLLEETISQVKSNAQDLEIEEIIVSDVISKPGNDFFDLFTSGFEWPEVDGDYIIIITEKPFRTSTTKIQIKVNELDVFENFLQPRASYLEELAQYAQFITTSYILNYQQIMKELEGADKTGTGIYE